MVVVVQFEIHRAGEVPCPVGNCRHDERELYSHDRSNRADAATHWYVQSARAFELSADGQTADIQAFSVSKQKLLGNILRVVPCTALLPFKEDASQAAVRVVREATE